MSRDYRPQHERWYAEDEARADAAPTPGKRTLVGQPMPVDRVVGGVGRLLERASRGGGGPLPGGIRGRLEGALGVDLGGVSIHTGADSAAAAAAVGAHAYAV